MTDNKMPEPVSIIGHGPAINFTSVQPALKSKPHGQIKCYAEDDVHAYARQYAAARAAPLVEALEALQSWARAYPLSVFPEPDFARAHELLQAGGMTLDAISASNMRHVITQTSAIVDAALASFKEKP